MAAVARNRVIGAENALPWSLPSDLRHFRRLTMGKPVLMGRRTFASIGRPLPGRHLVVLSRDPGFRPNGVMAAHSLDEALRAGEALAQQHGAEEVMVAGGGELYVALLPLAERLHVTEVEATPEGDTLFPFIDPDVWRCTAREKPDRAPGDEAAMAFTTWQRRARA